jgi:sulfate/thiosulfate transport system permease protein
VVDVPTPVKWLLRVLAVGYVFFLIAWPVTTIVREAFADGAGTLVDVLTDPQVQQALALTVQISVQAVLINLVFGVTMSILLVRYMFPGKRILSALIDLPMAVSPIVVGLSLLLVYNGRDGWFGRFLEEWGFQVIFSGPGMIMATCFVALPLVIREVVPVLQEIGDEQEQAAKSLGASPRQTFWRITLPSIKWAVVYGVVLSLARSLGEFGAVKIVSGNVLNQTQTATLIVEEKYQSFEQSSAYTVSFVLAFVSVLCIVVVSILRPKERH